MLPLLGWAAVAIGSAVVAAVASSGSSSSYEESDHEERVNEAEEEALALRNKKIKQDIKQYKKRQVTRFADKYGVDIKFRKYKLIVVSVEGNDSSTNPIDTLEEENTKLAQLIGQLEEMKNDSVI